MNTAAKSNQSTLRPRKRKSHIFARAPDDYYREPSRVSRRLFEVEDFDRDLKVLDPCTGSGQIAANATAAGYSVTALDLVDRGYPGTIIGNFLETIRVPPTVIGNPPFSLAEAFARHAFAVGAFQVALLFPTARLHAARANWLRELPLRKVYLLSPRPSMPPGELIDRGGKAGGGKVDYSWLVFRRGFLSTGITLDWLRWRT